MYFSRLYERNHQIISKDQKKVWSTRSPAVCEGMDAQKGYWWLMGLGDPGWLLALQSLLEHSVATVTVSMISHFSWESCHGDVPQYPHLLIATFLGTGIDRSKGWGTRTKCVVASCLPMFSPVIDKIPLGPVSVTPKAGKYEFSSALKHLA